MVPLMISKGYNPVIVSLFGLSDLKELPERIYSSYLGNAGDSRYKVLYQESNNGKEVQPKSGIFRNNKKVNKESATKLLHHPKVQTLMKWIEASPFLMNFVDTKRLFSQ